MSIDRITEILLNLLPAILVGAIAFYFFKQHIENEYNRRRFVIQRELQKESLPLRLQAYERLSLFLERISPGKLLVRVNPISSNKEDYENLLIATIEQELEHNLTQQIYVSDECWSVVLGAKNATIQSIRKATTNNTINSAEKLRETILADLMNKPAPSGAALSYIKKEVGSLW